jgi:hypothetical protein
MFFFSLSKFLKEFLPVFFQKDSAWFLYRILVYSGFQFIQDSSLFRIPVYTGFWFIQDSGLYRIPVINQNPV